MSLRLVAVKQWTVESRRRKRGQMSWPWALSHRLRVLSIALFPRSPYFVRRPLYAAIHATRCGNSQALISLCLFTAHVIAFALVFKGISFWWHTTSLNENGPFHRSNPRRFFRLHVIYPFSTIGPTSRIHFTRGTCFVNSANRQRLA